MTESTSPVERSKKLAAYQAVDDLVKDGMKLGIGSGSTIVYAVDRIVERTKKDNLKVTCVPTSFQARQLIVDGGLTLSDLENTPKLDLTIDGADEVDCEFNIIKGGGGALTQEKIVASYSAHYALVADHRKDSKYLGENWKNGVPIEVFPLAYRPVINKIESLLGGKAKLRMARNKAGPVVTDNGNFLVDWFFEGDLTPQWLKINRQLKMIPGIIETGLFIHMVQDVYFGLADGTVKHKAMKDQYSSPVSNGPSGSH